MLDSVPRYRLYAKPIQKEKIGVVVEHQKTSSCCSGKKTAIVYEYIDPGCGMQVAETSAYYFDYQDIRYLFCSAGCQQKFSAQPDAYLKVNQTPHIEMSSFIRHQAAL